MLCRDGAGITLTGGSFTRSPLPPVASVPEMAECTNSNVPDDVCAAASESIKKEAKATSNDAAQGLAPLARITG